MTKIETKLNELDRLIESADDAGRIPCSAAAAFLGISKQRLLAMAVNGECPFAMGATGAKGRREAFVYAVPLWNWYTGRMGRRND